MKRGETIQLLREIINRCSPTSIDSLSLIPPNPNSGSSGYALKIGTKPYTVLGESLLVPLKEKRLEIKEGKNSITIYKAKQKTIFPVFRRFSHYAIGMFSKHLSLGKRDCLEDSIQRVLI